MPDEMIEQLPHLNKLAQAMGLTALQMDGFEADDLMGTLAKEAARKGMEAVLVTGDKDFLQLVDENIKIQSPSD